MTRGAARKRSNLRDVAAYAGVSVATVSRVLNTPDKVASGTRTRVEAAISDLKFMPSAAARAINRGRSGMVAALLPTLDNAIYARVVNGLEARLARDNLSLTVAQTGDDPSTELARAVQMVDIGAEALIVVGVTHDPGLFDLMERAQIPVVATSYFDPNNRIPTIGYDNRAAALLAARHLVGLGHERIAVLHASTRTNDRMRQRNAALAEELPHATFVEASVTVEGGYEATERLLQMPVRPTAVLCLSDVLAHGALGLLNGRGISVPGTMSVMGIENLPSSQFIHPPLTSIRLSVEQMGQRAAEAVISWLETDTRPPSVDLPIELIRRASTAPPFA